ncbi:dihydrofolate reductase isoform X2 [Medicago truncatula]|uniref:dihydrofolate reductase isoform X2 n=1 Tax=Medicago truncatula TaxID=3880 RepID=UPI000D2F3A2D|nr:dihydrofolate reductase isoform X2 [Medicago truncatula]
MLLFLVMANLMLKEFSTLLIMSGSSSTRLLLLFFIFLFFHNLGIYVGFIYCLFEFTEYTNFDECLQYIEDYMIKHGPFDGLLGFSQGAILSGGLPGLQEKGVALTKVPKVKFLIIIGGAKFRAPSVVEKAYSSQIGCPSLHFLGEHDFLKEYGKELIDSCVEPVVIHHPKGHTVPRLDDKSLNTMMSFIERIQNDISENKEEVQSMS